MCQIYVIIPINKSPYGRKIFGVPLVVPIGLMNYGLTERRTDAAGGNDAQKAKSENHFVAFLAAITTWLVKGTGLLGAESAVMEE